MKKFIAILAALMLLISGCGDSGSDSSNSKGSGKKKEKEVVQLNDAEELPYYLYFWEGEGITAYTTLDAVEIIDITPELSFEIQNEVGDEMSTSVINSLEEDYVIFSATFNGRNPHEENFRLDTIVIHSDDFSEDVKFVKGDEVLPVEQVASFSKYRDDKLYELVDGMRNYTEIKIVHVIKREDIEDENIQIRLAGEDGWVYFNIER